MWMAEVSAAATASCITESGALRGPPVQSVERRFRRHRRPHALFVHAPTRSPLLDGCDEQLIEQITIVNCRVVTIGILLVLIVAVLR